MNLNINFKHKILSCNQIQKQVSVNGLLNNSSNANPLPLPDSINSTLSEEKRSGEATNHDSHCHCYYEILLFSPCLCY